jgi:hypothetical protein
MGEEQHNSQVFHRRAKDFIPFQVRSLFLASNEMKYHGPVRNFANCQECTAYPHGLCLKTEKYRNLVAVAIGTTGRPLM